ncbi:kirola-like [Cucumis melo var. makuwa]|uniref:Kirola-like n=1 Tax=Cucumis melo var. makuwa TaxID=1194695 RepID=A0A5D3BES5_CUCMM|nr:kirola-like [Cucumis melo var. makuwa]
MVLEQGVNETLEGQTLVGNQTEETSAINVVIAVVIDAYIGAAMDESHLHVPLYVLPSTSVEPLPLLPSNLYSLPSTDSVPNPSNHLEVEHPQIYLTFEVEESSAHSNLSVPTSSSSSIAHQQLEGL